MQIRHAKIALVGFVLFLVSLITLADSGHGRWLFALAETIPAGDKLGHLVLFGTLSFLVNLIWNAETIQLLGLRILKGSAAVMALTTLEECSQVLFRSRSFDLLDLASDALGIWLAGWLATACLQRKRSQFD
jgi:hypothetical protein